ncbi:MAG: ferredoxin [Firmicutes bacterium HGW-Firmicutes-7]|nr:MAG: ferredoxin [Firmicutes bacterium HGW-Firmicutes-7]
MIKLKINNKTIEVEEGMTILEAAKTKGILIPNLCYLHNVHECGSCRICVVEVEGNKNLQASCITKAQDGMVIHTHSEEVRKTRKILYELMISDHNKDCLSCSRNQSCELQELSELLGIDQQRYEGKRSKDVVESSNPSVERDMSKCILCRRCVTMCNEIQGVGVINSQNRGFDTLVGPTEGFDMMDMNCTFCGQCTTVCPVGALKEKDSIKDVWKAIEDPSKRVVVQTAPAVRAALGEEFGYPAGTLVTGKMAGALRELGFDDVFDTNFAADLTIIEEGNELLKRLNAALGGKKATLPMITSCSPGWIKYIEHTFPNELDHLSTCKSPHMMLGAITKSFYAKKIGVDPKDFYVVSVMPCTAKKYEITREEMAKDVDAVLTTRELAKMIKDAGIDFCNLEDSTFDNPLGLSSGAADIFGTTGGVMEAALRTVYEVVTGEELPFDGLHVEPIMGFDGIKAAEITITHTVPEWSILKGVTLKIAVASGLSNAQKLVKEIHEGTSPYHFIEIMCCPNGCISGGGQPRPTTDEIRLKRMEAIYREDDEKTLRKSHENPFITKLYEEFLGEPLGHKSHELLHTSYVKRGKFNELL